MKSQARLRLRKPKRKIEPLWVGDVPAICINCFGDQFARTGHVYQNAPVYQCLTPGCKRRYVNA